MIVRGVVWEPLPGVVMHIASMNDDVQDFYSLQAF